MREHSPADELAHTITHGIGLVLSVAGLAVLVVLASLRGNVWHIVSTAVYGGTLVMLYGASTLYHAVPHSRAKRVLRVVDHSAIFLLIAGTYTPFALGPLRGPWGWSIFDFKWCFIAELLASFFTKTTIFQKQLRGYTSLIEKMREHL